MKKCRFLVEYGLKKRVFRKAFLIANIIIGLLLIAIINLPVIIGYFSPEEDPVLNMNVQVYNETVEDELAAKLSSQLNEPYEGYEFFIVTSVDVMPDLETFWLDEDVDFLLVFTGDFTSPTVALYSKQPYLNNMLFSQIELLVISEQIVGFERPIFIAHRAPDYEDPDEAAMLGSIVSFLVLPMFILITMGTQFVGVDIIEEKSTKAIETIISSVPAKIHFLAKITSSMLFIIIQSMLLLTYSMIGALIGGAAASGGVNLPDGNTSLLAYLGDLIPHWPMVLLFTGLFMIAGTLFYLIVASLFASMATTQEDYQQFQAPLMIMLVAGFYIGLLSPLFGGTAFLKVMAFVPLFTPIVAPIAYASGVLTTLEASIAFVVITGVMIGTMYLVAPVYRVAILSYEQTKFFKRIRNYFKKAFARNGKGKKKG